MGTLCGTCESQTTELEAARGAGGPVWYGCRLGVRCRCTVTGLAGGLAAAVQAEYVVFNGSEYTAMAEQLGTVSQVSASSVTVKSSAGSPAAMPSAATWW